MNLYEEIKKTGVEMDSHESDLYCLKTDETTAIIAKHDVSSSMFYSEGKLWYDIPFAYQPFWDKKVKND